MPLQERSVIHVSPEEVMQPDRKRGPFRDVSFDARMLHVMALSAVLVAVVIGVLLLLAYFGLF